MLKVEVNCLMTTKALSDYAAIELNVQKRMETRFIGSIYASLKAQTSSFTNDLRNYGIGYARSRLSMKVLNPDMAGTIQRLHRAAGLFTARRVRQQVRIQSPKKSLELKAGFGFNERMVREIQEYFRIFLLEKAVLPISKTTIERINAVLNSAVEEGWGVDRIVQELEGESFRDMTRRRARTIIRTEVVRASNFGGMSAAFDSDWEMEKIWVEVKDARTRLTHRHGSGVGGQVRDLLTPYSNGGQFPGDPELPGKETINCRCAQAYRIKRDARGNPIPKRPVLIHAPAESLANLLAFGLGAGIGNLISSLINE